MSLGKSVPNVGYARGLLFYPISCCLLLLSAFGWSSEEPVKVPLKKVLILSSKGGGGHIAAANTLKQLIGQDYELRVIYPIDQLRIWGVPSGEQFYNAMLRNGWVRSMNFIVRHLAPPIFRSRMSKLEKIIASSIESHQPDLIISLIPFVNYPATEAARKKGVPYLMITTDNDLRNWAFGMEKIKHSQFKVTIGADLPMTRALLLEKNISNEMIEVVGLPLRTEFIQKKETEEVIRDLEIPEEKRKILIMMGAAGGTTAYEYARKIGRMDLGAHLIVVSGRNEDLREELEDLPLHPSNSLTAIGYTDQIADLMSISDVIITKPGPGTINEAIAMKLPILIDNTGISLFWERANVDMVLNYGIGEKIRRFKQVRGLLTSYLQDSNVREHLEESFVAVPSNQFHLKIQKIIEELIAQKEKAQ